MANETVNSLIVKVSIQGQVTGLDGTTLTVNETYEAHLGEGTGSGQVGAAWQDTSRALANSDEDLQLDGLTDFQGATMSTNAECKVLYIRNMNTTAGQTFAIGGSGGGNPWDSGPFDATDEVLIQPGGICLIVDPTGAYTITAGDDLEVTASATATTYRAIMAFVNA